jgi:DNA-binding response OmpR family regulator
MRILLAGEEVIMLRAMQSYLRLLGHQVAIAGEAWQVQSGGAQEPPDLIVMEFNLGWPGSEPVLKRWMRTPGFHAVPVVFFSRETATSKDAATPRIIARVTRPFQPLMLAGLVRFLDNMEWGKHPQVATKRDKNLSLLCR